MDTTDGIKKSVSMTNEGTDKPPQESTIRYVSTKTTHIDDGGGKQTVGDVDFTMKICDEIDTSDTRIVWHGK